MQYKVLLYRNFEVVASSQNEAILIAKDMLEEEQVVNETGLYVKVTKVKI